MVHHKHCNRELFSNVVHHKQCNSTLNSGLVIHEVTICCTETTQAKQQYTVQ